MTELPTGGTVSRGSGGHAIVVTLPPRHFDPNRDGYWDAYRYAIDPAYPVLAHHVATHCRRATLTHSR